MFHFKYIRIYSLKPILHSALIALMLFTACDKTEDDYFYEIKPYAVDASWSETVANLSVNASGPWTITSSEPWVKVTPSSGGGILSVRITINQNTTRASRTANITLFDSAGKQRQIVKVSQASNNGIDNIIIAHRGAYKEFSLPDNSVSALQKAVNLGLYGSECDINITSDGQVIVLHGESFGGLDILTHDYATLKSKTTLANGESLPLLSDFIKIIMNGQGTKLFVDVKSLSEEAGGNDQSIKAGVAAAKLIKEMGAESRTVFIIGRLAVLKGIASEVGNRWPVAYMNYDLPPQRFLDNTYGITNWGNFDISGFGKNPSTGMFDASFANSQFDLWIRAGVNLSFYNIDTEEQIQWYLPHSASVKACSNYPATLVNRVKEYNQ